MIARVALLLCLLALAVPAGAPAQTANPFQPLPPAQTLPPEAPAPTNTGSSNGSGGLKGWQQTLIFVAGGFLLFGIGLAIVKDARSRAPVEETVSVHESRERSEAEHRRRKQQARARAKRAKASRKKNRA